jgi:hypothetical protein
VKCCRSCRPATRFPRPRRVSARKRRIDSQTARVPSATSLAFESCNVIAQRCPKRPSLTAHTPVIAQARPCRPCDR